jgi:hypothetical protein
MNKVLELPRVWVAGICELDANTSYSFPEDQLGSMKPLFYYAT